MYVKFGEFRYQKEKQLLYRGDELLSLKRNQAALLDFFLSDAESVHSKDDILDAIWRNQEVSQQVVFQTISELRRILGTSAIKTFSKKGYRWNLPIADTESAEQIEANSLAPKQNELVSSNVLNADAVRSNKLPLLAIFSVVFLAVILLGLFFDEKQEAIVLQQLKVQQGNLYQSDTIELGRTLKQSTRFSLQDLISDIHPSQAFASPSLVFDREKLPEPHWAIWFETFALENGYSLHYGLARANNYWQGYVFANTKEQLSGALKDELDELFELGLFNSALHVLDVSTLKTMLEKSPNNPDLLILVAAHYQNAGQFDVALSYLQKIRKFAESPLSPVYLAQSHLMAAEIYKKRGQFLQANHSLDATATALSEARVWPLYFKYVETKAWLAYDETEYDEMQQTLQNALAKIESSEQPNNKVSIDPLRLFKFHILHSILSKKTEDNTGKYDHLNRAQAILLEHSLDESNLAVVLYHFALFARQEDTPDGNTDELNPDRVSKNSLVYLNRILNLPRTSDNFWVHDAALDMLVYHSIAQRQFDEINRILSALDSSPLHTLFKGQVLTAQGDPAQARFLFEEAFEQARINHDTRTAVDAALALYRLSERGSKTQAEYLAYLEANTSENWLRRKLNAVTAQSN